MGSDWRYGQTSGIGGNYLQILPCTLFTNNLETFDWYNHWLSESMVFPNIINKYINFEAEWKLVLNKKEEN